MRRFAVACNSGSFFLFPDTWQSKEFFNVQKARFFVSLKWAAKVIVKELFTNLDRFAPGSSSVVFLREESLESFVAARRAWNGVLFSSGRKVFYLYCSSRSTSLERCAVFLREESLLLYLLLKLNQFGASCHFPQGENTLARFPYNPIHLLCIQFFV